MMIGMQTFDEFIFSSRIAMVLMGFCGLLMIAVGLVTLAMMADFIRVCLYPSETKYSFCNSCSDKFTYGVDDMGVSTAMIEAGWLVLPSNVHYCPVCANMVRECCFQIKSLRIDVPKDFDVSKLDNLGPRDIVRVPINPYERVSEKDALRILTGN